MSGPANLILQPEATLFRRAHEASLGARPKALNQHIRCQGQGLKMENDSFPPMIPFPLPAKQKIPTK